ncbi:MAG: aspartate aminotransferase family protein [Candidatus Schekmanbacteria bacterium]|nr:aspartate aminotransferase family protein [Candidatus Schekmanbacteria bacterium]
MFYPDNNSQSYKLYQRAAQVMPGGVSHNLRFNAPYPVYYKRGRGAYFEDVDGNRFLDFWMGHYANILGHAPDLICRRLAELLADGVMHSGLVSQYEVQLAELVCELVPAAEQVRFCATGTEASMYAVRLARAYTGRDMIIKIEGGWHGANSDLMLAVSNPYDQPESMGLWPELNQYVVPLRFNDSQTAWEIIKKYGDRLAAVIMEPVVGVGGFIPAEPEFLAVIRQETERCGALLIFDEIISGFRVALGGAQELLGVVPDVVLLGKVLGAGLTVAAIAGKKQIMALADFHQQHNKWERVALGGGTYSCNPLAMAAGLQLVGYLKEHRNTVYPRLAAAGDWLRSAIVKAFAGKGVEAVCTGTGSLFMTHFPLQPGLKIKSPYDSNCLTDVHKREKVLKGLLLTKGIYVMHGGGAISTAHTQEDLEKLVAAMEEAAGEMQ